MSKKLSLPPAVKQLLTLRNPDVLPSPSQRRLNDLFNRTFQEAKKRNAETGWLVLTTCSILTANRPSSLGHLYRFVTSDAIPSGPTRSIPKEGFADAVNKAAIMRESALKSTIFVGVPRVILSLAALHEALEDQVKRALRKGSRRTATPANVDETLSRGRALWDSIYEPHAQKLHDKLGSYHPDFISFIIQSYGAVLAPLPGHTKNFYDVSSADDSDQGNLSRALGSIVGIACLRAEERVVPQLTSHVFGLLKARNVENQSAEDSWLSSDEGTEWVIRTVDEVLDALASTAEEEVVTKL